MSQQPKIGDRVKVNPLALSQPWINPIHKQKLYVGLEGKVVKHTALKNPKPKYGIEFDEFIYQDDTRLSGYHSCFGAGKLGHCTYLETDCFDVIETKRSAPLVTNYQVQYSPEAHVEFVNKIKELKSKPVVDLKITTDGEHRIHLSDAMRDAVKSLNSMDYVFKNTKYNLFPIGFNDFSEELFDKTHKEKAFEALDKAHKEISDARSLPFSYSKEDELILLL